MESLLLSLSRWVVWAPGIQTAQSKFVLIDGPQVPGPKWVFSLESGQTYSDYSNYERDLNEVKRSVLKTPSITKKR